MNLPLSAVRLRTDTAAPRAGYVDLPWGQVHRLESLPQGRGIDGAPPLYALHGTAYSGRTFAALMDELPDHRVVALDTPGYGGSTRPREPWSIPQYADALADAIEAAGEARVDLLGYHTGALIALQIAANRPDRVRRLVLIGVPYFSDPEEREVWRARLAESTQLAERLDQFDERWDYLVTGRAPGASLEQGFAHFVDELRAWPHSFWAHEAAFTFEPEACMAQVRQPTLVLNPATPLAGPSRRAAARLARAELVELDHLRHGVLDIAARELARYIHPFTAAS